MSRKGQTMSVLASALASAFSVQVAETAHETTFTFKLPKGTNDKGKLTFSSVRAVIERPGASVHDGLTYIAKLRSVNVRQNNSAGYAPIGIGRVLMGDECAILCALFHGLDAPIGIPTDRKAQIAQRYLSGAVGKLRDDTGKLVFGDALAAMIPAPTPAPSSPDNGTAPSAPAPKGKSAKQTA